MELPVQRIKKLVWPLTMAANSKGERLQMVKLSVTVA